MAEVETRWYGRTGWRSRGLARVYLLRHDGRTGGSEEAKRSQLIINRRKKRRSWALREEEGD